MAATIVIGLALLAYAGDHVFKFGRLADELVCRALTNFAGLVVLGA